MNQDSSNIEVLVSMDVPHLSSARMTLTVISLFDARMCAGLTIIGCSQTQPYPSSAHSPCKALPYLLIMVPTVLVVP